MLEDALEKIRDVCDSVVVCSRLGSDNQVIRHGLVGNFVQESFELPAILIVPGILNFKEEEALEMFS